MYSNVQDYVQCELNLIRFWNVIYLLQILFISNKLSDNLKELKDLYNLVDRRKNIKRLFLYSLYALNKTKLRAVFRADI